MGTTTSPCLGVWARGALAGVVAMILQGCGAASGSFPTYLPPATTTTTVPGTTATTAEFDPSSITLPNATSVTSSGTTAPRESWKPAATNLAGLPSECGNLSHISVHPTRDAVIVGVAQQGLWASADGAEQWTQLGQGEGSATITNRLTSIVYDPDDEETFWASGMYSGGGLFKTTDGGATFAQVGDVTHLDSVSVDLTDPARSTLLVGTHEQRELRRSTDGGATWTDLTTSLPRGVGFTSFPVVIDASTYLLGTRRGATPGVYRTTDGAETWKRVYTGPVAGPPLITEDGAMYWVTEGGGVIVSGDVGETWTEIPASGRLGQLATTLVELPDGRLATVGGQSVVISADEGQTWTSVGGGFPYMPNGLVYAPQRKAFYIWQLDCDFTSDNAVRPDSIMRLPFDWERN